MKKGISIHIGLNVVDASKYGSSYSLRTCIQDTLDMQDIAISQNFESSRVLVDSEATSTAVIEVITKASDALTSGDILFISYSGHGAFVEDKNADEDDGKDEVWCLYDRFLFDDELHYLWTLFEEGVRIFVISDSCHSGTVTKDVVFGDDSIVVKSFEDYVVKNLYLQNKEFYVNKKKELPTVKEEDLKARVKLISGCQDNEKSLILEGENSLLTEVIKSVWNSNKFTGNTQDFFDLVQEQVIEKAEKVGCYQTPKLYTIGKKNIAFDTQKPFSILSE